MVAKQNSLCPGQRDGFRQVLGRLRHVLLKPIVIRVLSLGVFLGLWEILGRDVNPILLSYPSQIVRAAFEITASGELPAQLLISLLELGCGLFAAIIVGVIVGVLMGHWPVFEATVDSYVYALYATPRIALIPLIILWFGLGLEAKIVIVFLSAVFPLIINSYIGVRDVQKTMIEVARSLGGNDRQLLWHVAIPYAVPYIITGIRLAIGRAVIGMITAEMFVAIGGLGSLLLRYGNYFQTAKLFVTICVLALLGVSLTYLVQLLEDRVAPWKALERARS